MGYLHSTFDYKSNGLLAALQECIKSCQKELDVSSIEITRMKDNLRNQMCVVCKMDVEGESIIIPRCCSNIIGTDCFKTANMRADKGEVKGKCPGCGVKINVIKDIVIIQADVNIEDLINAKGDEVVEEVVDESIDKTNEIKNPKLAALWTLMNKKMPENTEQVHFKINAVIDGCTDQPLPASTPRKILLFANYAETLNLVEDFLNDRQISHLQLAGDYKKMDQIVTKFKNEPIPILLINSSQTCAGLNLQFATTVIFFHKLEDPNVESQLIGRAQRINRTTNLEIIYLLYKNEA